MEIRPLRHRSPIRPADCNLAASFGLVGDKWSLLILRSALYGVRRFDDFCAELDIPRTVLSERLKRLVAAGIMIRQEYIVPGSRPRAEYLLTAMGEGLRLPFLAMTGWADKWLAKDQPPPFTLRRRSDGKAVSVGLLDEDGVPVAADDLAIDIAVWALDHAGRDEA